MRSKQTGLPRANESAGKQAGHQRDAVRERNQERSTPERSKRALSHRGMDEEILASSGGKIFTVTCSEPVKSIKILPTSFGIVPKVHGKTITITIDQPQHVTIEVNGNGAGVFRVHGPQSVSQFASAIDAIDEANRLARETAGAQVNAMGGGQVSFAEDIEKFLLPDAVDDNGLLRATVKIEATARPALSL